MLLESHECSLMLKTEDPAHCSCSLAQFTDHTIVLVSLDLHQEGFLHITYNMNLI